LTSAGISEIQQRFRRLALQHNPDKHAQATHAVRTRNENVLKDLQAARDVLIEHLRTGVELVQPTPTGQSPIYTYEDFDTTYAGAFDPDVKDPEFKDAEDKNAWEQQQEAECDAIIRIADAQLNDRLGELAGDEQNENDDLEHGSLFDGEYYQEARDDHEEDLSTDYTSIHINWAARSMNLRQIEMGSETRVSGHVLPENDEEDSDVEFAPGDDIDGPAIGGQETCRFATDSAANASALAAWARQNPIKDVQNEQSPEQRERKKKMLAQVEAQRKKDEAEFAERDRKKALLSVQPSAFRDSVHERTMELKAKQAATNARYTYTPPELPVDPSAIKKHTFSAVLQGEMSSKERPAIRKERRTSPAPGLQQAAANSLPLLYASGETVKSNAEESQTSAEDVGAGTPKVRTTQPAPPKDVSEEARREHSNRMLRWKELSRGTTVPNPLQIIP